MSEKTMEEDDDLLSSEISETKQFRFMSKGEILKRNLFFFLEKHKTIKEETVRKMIKKCLKNKEKNDDDCSKYGLTKEEFKACVDFIRAMSLANYIQKEKDSDKNTKKSPYLTLNEFIKEEETTLKTNVTYPVKEEIVNEKLNGGFHSGTCYLIKGTTGSGKTLLIQSLLKNLLNSSSSKNKPLSPKGTKIIIFTFFGVDLDAKLEAKLKAAFNATFVKDLTSFEDLMRTEYVRKGLLEEFDLIIFDNITAVLNTEFGVLDDLVNIFYQKLNYLTAEKNKCVLLSCNCEFGGQNVLINVGGKQLMRLPINTLRIYNCCCYNTTVVEMIQNENPFKVTLTLRVGEHCNLSEAEFVDWKYYEF